MEQIEEYCRTQNIENSIEEAFKCACKRDRLDIAKLILEYAEENDIEIDINAKSNSVIEDAFANKYLDIVELLLEYAKKNNFKIDLNKEGEYEFGFACHSGNLKIAKLLLKHDKEYKLDDCSFVHLENEVHILENDVRFPKDKPAAKVLLEYAEINNLEIDAHHGGDCAFRYACEAGQQNIIGLLMFLFNTKRDKFYFYKNRQYYIVTQEELLFQSHYLLSYESAIVRTKFDDFQVYHEEDDYLDDCIEAYKLHLQQFRKKSALSFIYDE
ncbi:MAG: hypothetical protein CMM93_09390 [Rickettsiales bacterium]|nr:hypothetical protein [Rickettsiales bacterium]